MNHPPLEELTFMIHGFLPLDEHVNECVACRRTAERLREELVLLREAEEEAVPLAPSPGGFLRAAPLALFAAILLAVVGAVLLRGPVTSSSVKTPASQDTRIRELIHDFLKGNERASAEARGELAALGRSALPYLIEARQKHPALARSEALGNLIFECKRPPAGDHATPVYEKIKSIRITVDMQNAPLSAVLGYIREISTTNIVIDPVSDAAAKMCSVRIQDVSLPTALTLLVGPHTLDYDFRYGVLFVAPPDRLWAIPPTALRVLGEEDVRLARASVLKLSSENPEERERAFSQLRQLGPPVIPILREGAKASDPEMKHRCGDLIEELSPSPRQHQALPYQNFWRSQSLAKTSKNVAAKLHQGQKKFSASLENTKIPEALAQISTTYGLSIVHQGTMPSGPITMNLTDLELGDALELLTLPQGLDARIEDGVITVFERGK